MALTPFHIAFPVDDLAAAPPTLGQNLVGEVCTARPREDLTPEPGLPADAAIRCGTASNPRPAAAVCAHRLSSNRRVHCVCGVSDSSA